MEITPSLIYWIGIVDELRSICGGIAIGCVVVSSILTIAFIVFGASSITNEADIKTLRLLRNGLITFASICSVSGLLYGFTPNQKTLASMYIIPAVVNSEFVQEELPSELRELYGLAKEYVKDSVATSKGGEE